MPQSNHIRLHISKPQTNINLTSKLCHMINHSCSQTIYIGCINQGKELGYESEYQIFYIHHCCLRNMRKHTEHIPKQSTRYTSNQINDQGVYHQLNKTINSSNHTIGNKNITERIIIHGTITQHDKHNNKTISEINQLFNLIPPFPYSSRLKSIRVT